jgi:SseB protein N-terminal domain
MLDNLGITQRLREGWNRSRLERLIKKVADGDQSERPHLLEVLADLELLTPVVPREGQAAGDPDPNSIRSLKGTSGRPIFFVFTGETALYQWKAGAPNVGLPGRRLFRILCQLNPDQVIVTGMEAKVVLTSAEARRIAGESPGRTDAKKTDRLATPMPATTPKPPAPATISIRSSSVPTPMPSPPGSSVPESLRQTIAAERQISEAYLARIARRPGEEARWVLAVRDEAGTEEAVIRLRRAIIPVSQAANERIDLVALETALGERVRQSGVRL